MPPLPVVGIPGDSDWMGLAWSGRMPLDGENISTIPSRAGLYLLSEGGSKDIIYIGQSADCVKRLRSHAMKFLDQPDIQFCVSILDQPILPHQLKELENDLIGNYFEVYRKAPEYQFGNKDL